MADTHGRKVALIVSSAVTACVTMLCALSTSYSWYIAGRILQGLGCSGLPIAAYVLATESVGPTYRGRAGTGAQMIYHIGEWVLPATAFLLQDWGLLYAEVAACCLVTGLLAAVVPESPRRQLLHGREAAAVRTLSWLARLNGRELPQSVAAQLQEGWVQELDQHAAAAGVVDTKSAAGHDKGAVCCIENPVQEDREDAVLLGHPPAYMVHKRHHADLTQDCHQQPNSGYQHQRQGDQHQLNHQQQLQQKPHHQHQHQQQQQRHPPGMPPGQGQLEWHGRRQSANGSNTRAKHQGDSVWMVFTSPLLARLFWVSVQHLAKAGNWRSSCFNLPGGYVRYAQSSDLGHSSWQHARQQHTSTPAGISNICRRAACVMYSS